MNEVQSRAMRGMMWGGLGSLMQQLLNMVVGVCLARLLSPDDYGLVGMLAVFAALAGTLQESGFTAALANRKEVSASDYNAVFWVSLGISVCCYAVLFFAAPLIADFYGEPELVWLSRYLFIGFVFASLGVAPGAWLFRNLMVRQRTLVQVPALVVSGAVGIALAWRGLGSWALATQTIVYVAMCSTWYWWLCPWHPVMKVDLRPVRQMLGFSSRLLLTNVFVQLQDNVVSVLLGRYYSRHEVGQFSQSAKWNMMGSAVITSTVSSVAQPALATAARGKEGEELELLRAMLRATAWLSVPALTGLALVARPFIVLLLGAKWLPCVPLLQVLCLWGAMKPINHLFTQVAVSRGRSQTYMWVTMSVAVVQVVGLMVCRQWGIYAMVWSYVVVNALFLGVWLLIVRRMVGLGLRMVAADAGRFVVAAAVAMPVAWLATRGIESLPWLLAARIVMGGGIYLALTHRQLLVWLRKLRPNA